MASFTAYMMVGGSHPNHGGITGETAVYLSENGRPALVFGQPDEEGSYKNVWIPTLEDPVEDALLFISACILQNEVILEELGKHLGSSGLDYVEMYELCTNEERHELYRLNRNVLKKHQGLKVVFTILEGSLFKGVIGVLKEYDIDMEVCLSVYHRFYSPWRNEIVVHGDLD